jgi:hypothetical protein
MDPTSRSASRIRHTVTARARVDDLARFCMHSTEALQDSRHVFARNRSPFVACFAGVLGALRLLT